MKCANSHQRIPIMGLGWVVSLQCSLTEPFAGSASLPKYLVKLGRKSLLLQGTSLNRPTTL